MLLHVFSSEWNLSLPFPFYYPPSPSLPPMLYRPLSELLTNSTFNVNYQFGRAKRTLLHSAAKWVEEWGTFPPTGCHGHCRYITVYFKQTEESSWKITTMLYVHAWRACVVVVLKFSSCTDQSELVSVFADCPRACPRASKACWTYYIPSFTIPFATPFSTGAADCVGYLLRKGASVDIQDKVGITALHLAARNG